MTKIALLSDIHWKFDSIGSCPEDSRKPRWMNIGSLESLMPGTGDGPLERC